MDELPVDIIRKIYEYDPTYKIRFDKVLKRVVCSLLHLSLQ